MQNKSILLLLKLSILSLTVNANEEISDNLVWISFNQNQYNYTSDEHSQLKPQGYSIGISHRFSAQWSGSISYAKFDAQTRWREQNILTANVYNQAKIDSNVTGLSINRLFDDFGLSFTFGEININEFGLTYLPRITENITSKTHVVSLSYQKFIDIEQWSFGGSFGFQYARSDIFSQQLRTTDVITQINSTFKQNNWSSFIDFDLSYLIENENFSWSPQLNLSWSAEISNHQVDKISAIRNGETIRVSQFNNRETSTYRAPDSGYWEMGMAFDWNNHWYTSITYGETISASIKIKSLLLDISVDF